MSDFNRTCQDSFDEEKIDWYTEGSCHLLAGAFLDLFNWPVGVFVHRLRSECKTMVETEWQLHAFALIPQTVSESMGLGDQQMAIDITGIHTVEALCEDWHCQDYDILSNQQQLDELVAMWDTWHERNLPASEIPTLAQQNALAKQTAGQMFDLLSEFFAVERSSIDTVGTLV